ncbi:MAG: tRNA lysidine(34) synthetase TilS [Chloroflexota bacterium]|nr:tRNA lysidine(34) synthetase TilS [Chloroflexota bacterium]MBI5702165.1 tRNA lysidine(34) synthetase TilS [Chloroflexota bacterium]
MFENIVSILRDQCGLVKDRPLIAGISGGPDSLCLLGLLREHGYRVIVAHFNHKLRSDADADANAVEQAASRMNFASVIESGDVREYAAREKLSIEEAARYMRYHFLMAQARRFKAQAVAVGHTADDQVETVLMHFIRGAGLAGLKGMTYRTILPLFDPQIPIVRPLLDAWREETIVYCAAHGLRPRFDPSNDSLDFLRNRLRHQLIPILESYNPRFREVLKRTAHSLAADHEILLQVVESAWSESVVQQTDNFIAFDIPALTKQPLGLQRHLIRRSLELLRPDNLDVTFAALERAVHFINDPAHRSRMELGSDLHLLREGALVYLLTGDSDLPIERWPQLPEGQDVIPLPVPGVVSLAGGWKMTSERWNMASLAMDQARSNDDPFQVWLDAKQLNDTLELRVRRDGDRFEPLGMAGHQMKLSDFFINVKLPQRARDRWPLLCMGDKVIWVPGYRPAHSFRLTENTRQAVYFSLTHG